MESRKREFINIPFPDDWSFAPSVSIYHSHGVGNRGRGTIHYRPSCTREPIGNSISDMIRSAKRLLKCDRALQACTNDLCWAERNAKFFIKKHTFQPVSSRDRQVKKIFKILGYFPKCNTSLRKRYGKSRIRNNLLCMWILFPSTSSKK